MKNILFTIFALINICNSVSGIRLLNIPINNIEPENELIGGLDTHGCMPGAGYFYCNYTDTCNRFNEPCVFNKTKEPEISDNSVNSDYSDVYVLVEINDLIRLLINTD